MRDAALVSLYNFSPTGKRGIHTLAISSKAHGSASLSLRERVVLRESFRRPHIEKLREGSFEGEVREADLDRTRFHLRTADGIIRCIMPVLHTEQARGMLGRPFRAIGKYDTDRDGRPRLLFVERIERLPEQADIDDGSR